MSEVCTLCGCFPEAIASRAEEICHCKTVKKLLTPELFSWIVRVIDRRIEFHERAHEHRYLGGSGNWEGFDKIK